MLSASRRVITHDKIIEVMKKLGYENVKPGVCNGLAQMWVQAVLCGEIEKFITRLYFICQTPDLLQKINAAKAKKGVNLTDEDRACIDILAFFDGVQLYQNFHLYTHLLNDKPHHLDAAAIAALTLPIKLEKQPIIEIYSENRLVSVSSLQQYLNELAKELALYSKNKAALSIFEPLPELVITLHSRTHKVVLRYNREIACWELTDANQYTPFYLLSEVSALTILQSLTEGIITSVNISVFTTADNELKNLIRTTLTKFKKVAPISRISSSVLPLKAHLLTLTAMRGDEASFVKVAKEIPNLNLYEYMLEASKTAMFHGQTGIVNIIIRDYLDCLMHPDDTQEFLAMAITNRHHDLIKTFVRIGADVDEPFQGQRPLHIAVEADNLEALKELISLDADITLTNEDDKTPLFYAIRLHRIAIVDYLAGLEKTNLEAPNKNGNTPLVVAVRQNSAAACEVLLKHKANPDTKNSMGETATLVSCTLGHEDCLNTLIRHGANLNLFDDIGRTPIFITVTKQSWNMVAMILLNLRTLESFNSFSYQITMDYLRDIIQCAVEQLEKFEDAGKKKFHSDTKHHDNALGMMLMKKPKIDFCVFFKPKEKQRQDYLSKIRHACKPASVLDADPRTGYIRL